MAFPKFPKNHPPNPIEPELGDHVMVPGCALLGGEVGIVVGFHLGRPTIASARSPNITVTLAKKQRVLPEHCVEHADCLAHADLAVACARSQRRNPAPAPLL